MKTFFALALAGAVSAFEEVDLEFMRYVVQFNKQYASVEEFESRKENFKLIHEEIKRFNQEETTSVHGHNYMSDWTREEYQNMLGLRNMTIKVAERSAQPEHMLQQFAPTYPVSYDWRTYSKVNAVKNQGSCGSCYAFATTTVLESNYAISNGTLWNLSEQQVVDCSQGYGNLGCDGGDYFWAWDYAHVTPITTRTTYPYVSGTTNKANTCTYSTGTGKVYASSQYTVQTDSLSMQTAASGHVLAVAVSAGTSYFKTYTSGILTSSACGTAVDHAVNIIGWGYNITAGSYWIVRNSWGTSWGLSGYVNIGWGTNPGICGINSYVGYATP